MAAQIIFWRHGQTDWNIQQRFQGSSDIPLNAVGEFQVDHAAKELAAIKPVKIVSSDLSRAKRTADALAAIVNLPVATDQRLRETHGGPWEGRTGAENRELDGENFVAWLQGADIKAGGTGESRSDVAARMREAVLEHIEGIDGPVVFASHGGAIRCGIGALLGWPQQMWGQVSILSNACWSVLELSPRQEYPLWILAEHNAGTLPEPSLGNENLPTSKIRSTHFS